jgi:hypothetical protein
MKKSARVRLMVLAKLGLAVGFAALASGCASLPKFKYAEDAPVDASSPVAADVIAAARHPGPYPRFADIPKLPRDVRSAAAWNRAVVSVKAEQTELDQDAASLTAEPTDTEVFAAEARRDAAIAPSDVPTATGEAQSKAYAKALRDRLKAPPRRR